MKKDSKAKIVSTYADALYMAAVEKNIVTRVLDDVKRLIRILQEDGDIIKYLSNPVWALEDKRQALSVVAEKLGLDKDVLSCLDVIAANGRFPELLPILEEFQHVWYRKNNIVEVDVQSVKSLSSAQNEKLIAGLEAMLSKKVVINYQIRPDVLGGLVIKFGSSMIDDSVRGKLNRLEIMMKGGQ